MLAVSFDEEIEAPLKRFQEKNWNKIKCLFGDGGFECDAGKKFNVHGIPLSVLVS